MAQRTNTIRNDGTKPVTFTAPTAITSQYRILTLSGTDTVAQASTSTGAFVGVNQTTTEAANKEITVKTSGYTLVQTGGVIAAGAYITSDASGRAISTVTGTDKTIGTATQASTAADQFIEIDLLPAAFRVSALV